MLVFISGGLLANGVLFACGASITPVPVSGTRRGLLPGASLRREAVVQLRTEARFGQQVKPQIGNESMWHTKFEVFGGLLLGTIIAYVMSLLV